VQFRNFSSSIFFDLLILVAGLLDDELAFPMYSRPVFKCFGYREDFGFAVSVGLFATRVSGGLTLFHTYVHKLPRFSCASKGYSRII
jgi:hypothetical protein